MSSSNTSPESWIGKLVWIFPRDERGVQTGETTTAIVIREGPLEGTFVVMSEATGDGWQVVWERDMEEVEEWSEELEGEDGSVEEP